MRKIASSSQLSLDFSTIPPGMCQCGCGQPTRIARQTRDGATKGTPFRFIAGHNKRGDLGLAVRPDGHRQLMKQGYYEVKCPTHPHACKRGYVLEHRLVMEGMISRYLNPQEVVHHKDDNGTNNDPSNLQLFTTNAEHMRFHAAERRRLGVWSKDYPCCSVCGTTKKRHNGFGYCHVCYKQVMRSRGVAW